MAGRASAARLRRRAGIAGQYAVLGAGGRWCWRRSGSRSSRPCRTRSTTPVRARRCTRSTSPGSTARGSPAARSLVIAARAGGRRGLRLAAAPGGRQRALHPGPLASPRRALSVVAGVVALSLLTGPVYQALFDRSSATAWLWTLAVVVVAATQVPGLLEPGRALAAA